MIRNQLINAFKQQIIYQREIEQWKKKLALLPDFNLMDVFLIFDEKGRGFFTRNEFEKGLLKLDFFPTLQQMNLLFKYFDQNSQSLIQYYSMVGVVNFNRFSDFAKSLFPTKKEYEELMLLKQKNDLEDGFVSFLEQIFG